MTHKTLILNTLYHERAGEIIKTTHPSSHCAKQEVTSSSVAQLGASSYFRVESCAGSLELLSACIYLRSVTSVVYRFVMFCTCLWINI